MWGREDKIIKIKSVWRGESYMIGNDKSIIKYKIMKKILFTIAMLFLAFAASAQKIDGKWVFEKMNLSGYIIYFDDSKKDKEDLIKAWIRVTGAEGDQDEKKEIIKNKELIYTGLKEIYKSSIEFKGMKYDQVIKGTFGNYRRDIGKLVFAEQGDEGKTVKKEVAFQITTSSYEDDGYNILDIEIPQEFHAVNELKVKLKDNSLVLEKVKSTSVEGQFHIIDEENILILYFKKK